MRQALPSYPVLLIALGAVVSACGPSAPQPKAPERITVKYVVPVLDPVQKDSETQEKGQMVIQTVPVPVMPQRTTVRSCRRIGSGNLLANVIDSKNEPRSEYEVRLTPAYEVPDALRFKILVTNRTSQVVKLESAVLRFKVDEQEYAHPEGISEAVLTPGEKKEFSAGTPSWRTFPSNATLLFGIYGVPTEFDAAGTVTKRENFEWAFKFNSQEKAEDAEVAVSSEQMTHGEANACLRPSR
jgi:hypothetical protein